MIVWGCVPRHWRVSKFGGCMKANQCTLNLEVSQCHCRQWPHCLPTFGTVQSSKSLGHPHQWGCVSKFVSNFLRRINEVDIPYSTISWWFISQLYIYCYKIKYYKPGIICGISRPLSYKTMVVTPIFQALPLSGPEPLWELGLADNFITDKGLEELLRPGEWTWWADHETYHLVMTNIAMV